MIVELGENRLKPVLQFRVLLLSGQFERVSSFFAVVRKRVAHSCCRSLDQAIEFLHRQSQYQTDAVHFAIALEYYGFLRIPSKSSPVGLRAFAVARALVK